MNPKGEYVDAKAMPGSVVVNCADCLEFWSSGKLKSTRHRVMMPNTYPSTARQSMVFFLGPDNDVTVSCVDGSDKYPTVNAYDYIMMKYKETYG